MARAVDRDEMKSLTEQPSMSVFDVVKNRLITGSCEDGHRLGLVVEGGGMRGVYTAGALLGLHAMGAATVFDDVYATSAGAMNAAYFLSGLGEASADGYYRVLADRRFMNPLRPWKFADVDFVIDRMLVEIRPLDVERLFEARTRLWVPIADFDTATALLFRAKRGDLPLLEILRAAIALPVFYNRLVRLGEVRGFDAGLCNPLPVESALRDGCSHVLVLTSRPPNHLDTPAPPWKRAVFDCSFARGRPELLRMFDTAWKVANRSRLLALGARGSAPEAVVSAISPPDAQVNETTKDRSSLRSALLAMARLTLRAFAHDDSRLSGWERSGLI